MKTRFHIVLGLIVLVSLLTVSAAMEPLAGQDKRSLKEPMKRSADKAAHPWTLEESMQQLNLYPRDAYLQYVALQLARRDNRLDTVGQEIERLVSSEEQAARNGRAGQVDLFSIFTGALAVQESLQLDTMRGPGPRRQQRFVPGAPPAPVPPPPGAAGPPGSPASQQAERERRAAEEKRRKERVNVAALTGPTIKSHPWEKMLAGRKPEISPMAHYVPSDFYFVEFRSVTKLLEALNISDLWGTHLFNQASQDARSQLANERLKQQLVVETNPILRPFYDLVVDEAAVTGSDLFLREGSDVTLLFRFKQPDVFKTRMDKFLANAEKSRTDVRRETGQYLGVDYVHLETPDRAIHVFAAYPAADLHVRSNSVVAFRRILEAIQGKTADGKPVQRLGDTAEFAYIRTLLPRGTREEDGLAYLSDPFIRRLVGPQLKLTERRRMLCYNHLRMIGHAALLYRTEHGKLPRSLEELVEAECAPGLFGEGDLACPDGGKYRLSADGASGICSHHGHSQALTPCSEIPVTQVSGEEADEYNAFLQEYNQYWRTFFDPIALRLQITPQRYRLETVVLPLIDNSIYTGLARMLGGKPEALDALPVPKRNIFSLGVRFDKAELIRQAESGGPLVLPRGELERLKVKEFLSNGAGSQVGLHVYDAVPLFDFNLPSFLGLMLGNFSGRQASFQSAELPLAFVAASLNAPAYVSLPVQDAKVVDDFLTRLDSRLAVLARQRQNTGFIRFEQDFYNFPSDRDMTIRSYSFRFGPIKWRFFWGRVGNGLYIASKPFIIEDLLALEAGRSPAAGGAKEGDVGPQAHAMVRIRPQNWNQVLPDYRLAWAENNREACLHNLGPLSSSARALGAKLPGQSPEESGRTIHQVADRQHGVHFFCPERGRYLLSPDGKTVTCSVHGSAVNPRQPVAPVENGTPSNPLREFAGMTVALTFLEDGLHAVVIVERK